VEDATEHREDSHASGRRAPDGPAAERHSAPRAEDEAAARNWAAEPVTGGEVYSVANFITIGRLLLVPFFFVVLISTRHNKDLLAFVLFATAALTDWLDGLIARRTNSVTALGKVLDPIVDRALIVSAVVGLFIVDRLPLWVVLLLVVRDVYLLAGAWYLERRRLRVPVVYIGKVTTAVLLAGFCALIAGWPVVTAPGSAPALLGIYFVYAGLVLSISTAVRYTLLAVRALSQSRANATSHV
jgi:cardiolipin synthase (CMP-forming)